MHSGASIKGSLRGKGGVFVGTKGQLETSVNGVVVTLIVAIKSIRLARGSIPLSRNPFCGVVSQSRSRRTVTVSSIFCSLTPIPQAKGVWGACTRRCIVSSVPVRALGGILKGMLK